MVVVGSKVVVVGASVSGVVSTNVVVGGTVVDAVVSAGVTGAASVVVSSVDVWGVVVVVDVGSIHAIIPTVTLK